MPDVRKSEEQGRQFGKVPELVALVEVDQTLCQRFDGGLGNAGRFFGAVAYESGSDSRHRLPPLCGVSSHCQGRSRGRVSGVSESLSHDAR
ncbi:hypothetical protein SAMN05216259_101476 [Actinacidiphila guanduensis]|uniref:Uncharacterized protein n=1 Tax=Actinacidiphila guanduensis TaxID=310781 RepID=A0A1G9W113_9ACTN|nr:hypothetical protein SAMN05216259_101476 [Actinacidiphila guanduensis]